MPVVRNGLPQSTKISLVAFSSWAKVQKSISKGQYSDAWFWLYLFILGTTWTQEIVWQVLHGGRIDYRRIDVRIPWIEGMLYPYKENPYKVSSVDMIEKMFESFPSPRVFKSHLRYQLIPKATDKTRKPCYIYAMRSPKDTAVSLSPLSLHSRYKSSVVLGNVLWPVHKRGRLGALSHFSLLVKLKSWSTK